MSEPAKRLAQQAKERFDQITESVREKFDEIIERQDKMSDSRFAEKIKNGLFAERADRGVDQGHIDGRPQEQARPGAAPAA
jgi:hypothetical protein